MASAPASAYLRRLFGFFTAPLLAELNAALEGATKEQVLMARWRFPTLSIHGIEGAFSDPGAKTVVPRRVAGKFSIRLVPDMKPEATGALVVKYLEDQWKTTIGSKYALSVKIWSICVDVRPCGNAGVEARSRRNFSSSSCWFDVVYSAIA